MINKSEKIRKVELVAHDPTWVQQFEQEAEKIKFILADNVHAVHHIGSTAIAGIYAKPIIDFLVVVNDLAEIDELNPQFESLGYTCMGEYGISGRRFYWKTPTKHSHHIHLFEKGNTEIKRHLAFRDYLCAHADMAQGYSWIKRCLAAQFPHDIEAYVQGKSSFIETIDYFSGAPRGLQLQAEDNIQLYPFNANWPELAAAEINAIKNVINLPYVAIEHLGSTAVEGLSAKPIIDIFIALKSMHEAKHWIAGLKSLGYIDWPENPDKTHDRYFKGMPPFGKCRTHHVHIMQWGDDLQKRILFRDLLRSNVDLRHDYEKLKQSLAIKYYNDREGYTKAKADFIARSVKA